MAGITLIVFAVIESSAFAAISSDGYELVVISSIFVRGVSLQGRIGTIQNTFIASLILGFISNRMILANTVTDTRYIIEAIVLATIIG